MALTEPTPQFPFSDKSHRVISSAFGAFAVTPDDNYDFGNETGSNKASTGCASVTRGISFATAGALKVKMANDQIVTITSGALAAGVIHPIMVKRVYSTGTGALNIWAWF